MYFERVKSFHDKHEYTILPIKPGMFLEVQEKIKDENNRIRKFKGLVIKVNKPQHADGSFTMKGTVAGMDVEKIYPLSFDKFAKVILLDEYKVRRAKLYYIRDKVGKDARFKSKITAEKRDSDLIGKKKKDLDPVKGLDPVKAKTTEA
ncbi:MAG: 50S ribosomal protein L19 [Candidatus Absconditabacterales bacterium]